MPEEMKKAFIGEIKEVNEKDRTIVHYISTEAIDRDKEILKIAGCDLKNFNTNRVVLWAHNYGALPIGKSIWVRKPKDGSGILAKTEFAPTQFADEVFTLYKEGFLNAWSVGFIPTEMKDGENDKVRQTIEKWELLEYSAVPVPSNPEALALAYQKGMIGDTLAKDLGVEITEKKVALTPEKIVKLIKPDVVVTTKKEIPEPREAQPKELTGERLRELIHEVVAGVRDWAVGKVK